MAMKLWTCKYQWQGEVHEYRVQAGEDAVRSLGSEIRSLCDITSYHKELRGWKDEPGSVDEGGFSFIIGGHSYDPVTDQAGYEADVNALLAKLPAVGVIMKGAECKALAAEAKALFRKHLPIRDVRKDRAEEAAKEAQYQAADAANKARAAAERAEFVSVWAIDRPVTIPDDQQAVYLQLCYDGSDYMSDYYHTHAHVPGACGLLLGYLPKRAAQTEAVCRQALARYPGILALQQFADGGSRQMPVEFEWHTEKYANGHGNYLQSGVIFRMMLNEGSEHEKEIGVHLEVEFTSSDWNKLLPLSDRWRTVPQPEAA